ncbi:GntR family transcriptional regulator [Ancylobacter sp. 6x-1]|uniref:GntR family transcriptional regulator n=1 Tax=Ancylobacter crimeensis TaxID=2579147 RepID=A0ABT0D848_9HYPH|nr:GntR family transcriptional regulator [Ancylobacter crimeensis]MCK0196122.1 GntR family transcriptional regulator [Ancylobacter crimeensis]
MNSISNLVSGSPGGDRTDIPAGERPRTLAKDVYARLKQAIFDFRMPPGQRYSEQELCGALEVSRTPLRLALHILAHEGFVANVGGHSAWMVRPLDLAYYEDLYDFRVELEVLAWRRAASHPSAPVLGELVAFWQAPAGQRPLEGHHVAEQDEMFHRTIVGLFGNRAMLRSFDELTDRIRIIRRLDFVSPKRIATTYNEHAALLDAVRDGDADRAERLIRAHIEASRVEIRRLTFHHLSLATSAARQGFQGTGAGS